MEAGAQDHAWLEKRLELHQEAIEAQLERHYNKLLAAVETRSRAVRQELMVSPSSLSCEQEVNNTDTLCAKSSTLTSRNPTHLTQPDEPEAPGRRSNTPTALRHLIIEDTDYEINPASMRGKLAVFLGTYMATFINCCICANIATMIVELQMFGDIANASLGLERQHDWPNVVFGLEEKRDWSNASEIFTNIDRGFAILFCLELLLQLFAFRSKYFKSRANIMDTVIVVMTSLDVLVLTPLANTFGNVIVFRLLRLAKVARALKVARAVKSFEALRVLVATMYFSFMASFWSLVIMFALQIMGAVFMCESLHHFVVDPSNDLSTRMWVNSMYGDGLKSYWTIFELTFSGCWPNYARRIIEEVSPFYSIFYFVYVYVVVFVTVRIVSALFMKETLEQCAIDAEMMVKQRTKKSAWIKQTVYDLFDEADVNNDGFVSTRELDTLFSHKKVKMWLTELGVDASDKDTFIKLLDHGGEGKVTRDEFLYGVTRLKGEARSQDLAQVFNTVNRIHDRVKVLSFSMDRIAKVMAASGMEGMGL